MRVWRTIAVGALLLIIAGGFWLRWKAGEPRRFALQTLGQLDAALRTGNSADLLKLICTPAAIQGRTAPEQAQFLTKALADEISPEGLVVLQRQGTFGPLTNVFPAEAEKWAKQAGVRAEDCVAFKLERRGLCAEVVLAQDSALRTPHSPSRIVRCNHVRQMAMNSNHE
jgi:hypothetical protein